MGIPLSSFYLLHLFISLKGVTGTSITVSEALREKVRQARSSGDFTRVGNVARGGGTVARSRAVVRGRAVAQGGAAAHGCGVRHPDAPARGRSGRDRRRGGRSQRTHPRGEPAQRRAGPLGARRGLHAVSQRSPSLKKRKLFFTTEYTEYTERRLFRVFGVFRGFLQFPFSLRELPVGRQAASLTQDRRKSAQCFIHG